MVVPWDSHDKICQDFNLNLSSSFCFLRFFIFANWGPEKTSFQKLDLFIRGFFRVSRWKQRWCIRFKVYFFDSPSGVKGQNFPRKKKQQPPGIFLPGYSWGASQYFCSLIFGMGKIFLPSIIGLGLGLGDGHCSPRCKEGSTTFRDMPWGRGIEVKAEAKSVWGFLGNYCNGGKRTHPRTFSKENKIWRKIGVLMLYIICTELLWFINYGDLVCFMTSSWQFILQNMFVFLFHPMSNCMLPPQQKKKRRLQNFGTAGCVFWSAALPMA